MMQQVIRLSKNQFSWQNTIYVLGLPRSGKSTIFNLIASCRDTEAVDEPYELQLIAQKGGQYDVSSEGFLSYSDSYLAIMENYFSELVLGRRYNFRKIDKSFIFNVKGKSDIRASLRRAGRSDVLKHSSASNVTFAISYNNVENSIIFITNCVPSPKIIYIHRNIDQVIQSIADKNWLSDEQLSSQANLNSAYRSVSLQGERQIYIPYLISDDQIGAFLGADRFRRAEMYCVAQENYFTKSLDAANVTLSRIKFGDLLEEPDNVAKSVFEFAGLKAGIKTPKLLDALRRQQLRA